MRLVNLIVFFVLLSTLQVFSTPRYRQFDRFWISSGLEVDGNFWYKQQSTNVVIRGQDYAELFEGFVERIAITYPEVAFDWDYYYLNLHVQGSYSSTNFHIGTNFTETILAGTNKISVIDVFRFMDDGSDDSYLTSFGAGNYYEAVSVMRGYLSGGDNIFTVSWSWDFFTPIYLNNGQRPNFQARTYGYGWRTPTTVHFLDPRFNIDDYINGETILQYDDYSILASGTTNAMQWFISTNGTIKTDFITVQTRSSTKGETASTLSWPRGAITNAGPSYNDYMETTASIWNNSFPYFASWGIYVEVPVNLVNGIYQYSWDYPLWQVSDKEELLTSNLINTNWWNYSVNGNPSFLLNCETEFKTNKVDIEVYSRNASFITCNTNHLELINGQSSKLGFGRPDDYKVRLGNRDSNAGVQYCLDIKADRSKTNEFWYTYDLFYDQKRYICFVTPVVSNAPFYVDNVIVQANSEFVTVNVKRNMSYNIPPYTVLKVSEETPQLTYSTYQSYTITNKDDSASQYPFVFQNYLFGSVDGWYPTGILKIFDYGFGKLYVGLNMAGTNYDSSPYVYKIGSDDTGVAFNMTSKTNEVDINHIMDYENYSLASLNKVADTNTLNEALGIMNGFKTAMYDLGSVGGSSYFTKNKKSILYFAETNNYISSSEKKYQEMQDYCDTEIKKEIPTNPIPNHYGNSAIQYESHNLYDYFYPPFDDYYTYEDVSASIIMESYTNCFLNFPNIYWYTNNYIARIRLYITVNYDDNFHGGQNNNRPYAVGDQDSDVSSASCKFLSPLPSLSRYATNYFVNCFTNANYNFPTNAIVTNGNFSAVSTNSFSYFGVYDCVKLNKIYDSIDSNPSGITNFPSFEINAILIDISKSSEFWSYVTTDVSGFATNNLGETVYTMEGIGRYFSGHFSFGNLYAVIDWNFKHCNTNAPFVPVNYTPPWMSREYPIIGPTNSP